MKRLPVKPAEASKGTVTLVHSADLRLVNIECMPNSEKFNAIVDLGVDIADLLPYLAAEIRGCTYIHGTEQLNYMDRGHIIAMRSKQLTVTAVRHESEARRICDELIAIINDVYRRRSSITPILRKQARLGPLAVYRELPGTNCGLCGEATCLAFAARVVGRELLPGRCSPLLLEEYKEKQARLWDLLSRADYEVD
jgi:ArsR family metal-binding transcriptional regulator